MRLRTILRTAAVCLFLSACAAKEEQPGLMLYYPQVTNIGPSMTFISDAPSYHGPKPSDFAITSVSLDGKTIQTSCFAVNEASGSVSISDSKDLATGLYSLSISCMADGRKWDFKDIFKVNMIPIAPESVSASEAVVEIPLSEVLSSDKTVSVVTVGESVTILGYELVQEEGKDYFKITKDGLISVNKNFKGEILPGVYPLTLKMNTYAGEAVYENFVTIKLTSAPLTLAYPSEGASVEAGLSFVSGAPVCKASPENLSFSLKAITPAADKVTVDPSTGVISVAEGNSFKVSDVYVVDITVTNLYGSTDFLAAFTLTAVAFIRPVDPSSFAYEALEIIQGSSVSAAPKAGLVGDELSFSFVDLPAALEGKLSIGAADGVISAPKGNSIAKGTYSIKVKAANNKSEATATLSLTVVENPYYFTFIRFGNNLGLPVDGSFADQFLAPSSADYQALELVPQTDIKEGVAIEWSVVAKHNCGGTSIDPSTGKLTLGGFKANNGGLILVTGVAGKGEDTECSVTVPVFFSFLNPTGVNFGYKPFVVQCNPRKGVRGTVPQISGIDDASKMLLDYRRTFSYYNINGPESHISGLLNTTATNTFIYKMWATYFGAKGAAVNAGSKDPVSYYSNQANLNQALLYIDAADKSLVVNPNKWMDADGVYANGAFIGQVTYVLDGNQANINTGTQFFPLWVWFDEKF
ncbi:MAG: DUF4958 family protein [Bacteroidales bacterium]|nr:DUF4958 family protein [Bacteroidales bacterium]